MSNESAEESKKLLTDNMIITNLGFQIYTWYLYEFKNVLCTTSKNKNKKKEQLTCEYLLNLTMCYAK